jgi:enoyl-CoA hydratase
LEQITFEHRGPVAWIAINRPPLNLLGKETWRELDESLRLADSEDDVRVVVLTGAGDRAFSAGANITELPDEAAIEDRLASTRALQHVISQIDSLSKPTIAAVNGYALGGGCQIAIACTFRIASEKAQFGIPEINLGLVPALGALQRLGRLIGSAWATEIILTGRNVDAQEAYRMGLVNRVVPAAELQPAVQQFGEMLAEKSRAALSLTMAALRVSHEASAASADLLSRALLAISTQTEESRHARKNFKKKSG